MSTNVENEYKTGRLRKKSTNSRKQKLFFYIVGGQFH